MKRKRDIKTRQITKYKARRNMHGGQQHDTKCLGNKTSKFCHGGVQMSDGSRGTHVLKLLKNVYGQKQASRVWYDHLKEGLVKIGFTQSAIDECVFYR
eukprot:14142558-Ditylum_brightwellii.AAC.1